LSYKYSPRNLSIGAPSESVDSHLDKALCKPKKACGGDRYE
jgi:hypothetical protein